MMGESAVAPNLGEVEAVEAPSVGRASAAIRRAASWPTSGQAARARAASAAFARVRLDAEDLQVSLRRPRSGPKVEQGEKIAAEAEPQFADDEAPAASPALGQRAAGEKDGARLP